MSLRVLLIVTILWIAPVVRRAEAYSPHDLPRWFGIGFSDGYHARTGCPPKQSHLARPHVSSYPATWSSPQPAPRAPAPGNQAPRQ